MPSEGTAPAARSASGTRAIALITAIFGAAFYAVFASGAFSPPGTAFFGHDIYDYYYRAVLDGRLDLPIRVLRLEGHYTPDGTGFLYHGLAPLMTRFAFGWAFPFGSFSMAAFSIWFWAVLGTAFYHAAFLKAGHAHFSKNPGHGYVIGLLLWFAGPGLLLSSNPGLYNEPISVAFAMTACVVFLWVRYVAARVFGWQSLILMALCAGLSVHARPNIAIGLYAVTLFAILIVLRSDLKRGVLPAVIALGILGLFGSGYVLINALKFGSPVTTHGSFTSGEVQQGFAYWGLEDENSERARGFNEHGRFNPLRVIPNGLIYTFDLPQSLPPFKEAGRKIRNLYADTTQPLYGFVRFEVPRIGIAYLWPGFLLLGAFALRTPRSEFTRYAPLMAGLFLTLLLTLSYATITLRYRVDLWPFIAVIALLGLAGLNHSTLSAGWNRFAGFALGLCAMLGISATALAALIMQIRLTETDIMSRWDFETCVELVVERGFSQERSETLCALPS
ncbi:hypothetical protein JM93_01015 [Roseibium hamelinense]|uniref:Dolichyl-phosphate-mannose-protein mannosyltransferase n=1 Tax=Roseibium hamelinense TaxID=150831 RepID=A0A562T8Y6_9HYPH|nr:hypothetical protein [Roseibium hamelinense]MTI45584.1 hypothetical protein [Roseibium hamelinense]TWI90039.1 hypothetical protein JM93_01015 [Roseibium hamelinense]